MSRRLAAIALTFCAGCLDAYPHPGKAAPAPVDLGAMEDTPADAAMATEPNVDAAMAMLDASVADAAEPPRDLAVYDAAKTLPSDVIFSDTFENGLDATLWTQSQQGGTAVVDTVRAAAGTHALHAHVQNTGQPYAFAVTKQRFPLAGKDTFMRAFVYVARPLTHHAQIFRVWHAWADGYDLEVLWNGTDQRMNFFETWYYQHTSSEPNDQQYTENGVPTGSWHCWEWEINGSTDELHLWLDGVQQAGATVPSTRAWLAPLDAPLSLGWTQFHDEPATPQGFDVWIDDVVVSRSKIGCNHLP